MDLKREPRRPATMAEPRPRRATAGAPATAGARADLKAASFQQGQAMLSPRTGGQAPGHPIVPALADLTPSQRRYIEALQILEAANPRAQAKDIAMALSLLIWEGRIWDKDGKASNVTKPAGVPLVGDYKGGAGYKDVKMTLQEESFFQSQAQVQDRQGRRSGVSHVFPAVAAQAGREGTMAGSLNRHMVTHGGDLIQDIARILVDRNLAGVFREAEKRDNDRAAQVASKEGASSRPLSEALLERFRAENAARPAS